jgi:hypothetical protein
MAPKRLGHPATPLSELVKPHANKNSYSSKCGEFLECLSMSWLLENPVH